MPMTHRMLDMWRLAAKVSSNPGPPGSNGQEVQMTDYTTPQPCGCSLFEGRCDAHAAMMRFVREWGYGGSAEDFAAVGAFADGFGSPGYNIGDWSAWRDSSLPALEAMYSAAAARRA